MGQSGITLNEALPNVAKAKVAILNLLKSLNLIDSGFSSDKRISQAALKDILKLLNSKLKYCKVVFEIYGEETILFGPKNPVSELIGNISNTFD